MHSKTGGVHVPAARGMVKVLVSDPEVHRAEATRMLHARVRQSAEACGMQLDRLGLAGTRAAPERTR